MRVAGRFARRVKGWAKGAGVPIVYSKGGERNEDLAKGYVPDDPSYEGVFVAIVGRAPGNVWDVEHTADGRIRRIKRKGRAAPSANSRHLTPFSRHFGQMDPDTPQRQERQIVQSQLDLYDFLS